MTTTFGKTWGLRVTEGLPYFSQLSTLTDAHATRWVPDHRGLDALATEGEFARQRM